jgi:TRAP-type uncharacterized transport system substrate-binding protein
MIYVIGAPAPLFAKMVSVESQLHLLPLEGLNPELYTPTVISADTYKWQTSDVKTVAVSALLVTRDYKPGQPQCTYVGQMTHVIVENLERLQQEGHSKWRSVKFDLAALKKHPDISPCVLQAFEETANAEQKSAEDAGDAAKADKQTDKDTKKDNTEKTNKTD